MPLPKQVREQGEESDRLIADAIGANDEAVAPVDKDKPADEVVKIDPSDYKTRFSLMKDKYDKLVSETIPDLNSKISQRDDQVLDLTRQVADLAQKLQAVPAVSETPAAPVVNTSANLTDRIMSVLSEGEKETYSDDFIDMLGRVINSVQSENKVDPQLESRLEKVETTQHLTAEERFWKTIDTEVSNWREVQKTPAFQKYLKRHDPLLGTTREAILGYAQEELNAERAVAVFTDFINGKQSIVPDDDEPGDTINPLEKHVVPEDTGSGGMGELDAVPQLTTEEIEKFYIDVALGRYKTRPNEERAMENAIRKIHSAAQPQQPQSVDNKTEY